MQTNIHKKNVIPFDNFRLSVRLETKQKKGKQQNPYAAILVDFALFAR